ncbi:MAG TPA: glycosyltransferase family 4 protein [Longimicrobiales bacterium]|nr:glycosyltransferase family 4 protein [Longimicrobiales bacterium]
MSVLYVSKASRVLAHRDKLAALAGRVALDVVVPERWGAAPDEGDDPRHPPLERVPARLHGHNHLHWYPGLGGVLDRMRPTLVHADEEPYSLVTLQVARLCARRMIPFVYFAWQNLDKRLPPPFGRVRRYVYAHAAGGIAGTPAAARVLERSGWRGPTAVIAQMGVDPERFRPDAAARAARREALGIPEETVVVGYVGRLIPAKAVDVFVDAVAAVRGLHAVVVGAGPEGKAMRWRAARSPAADRVAFTGAVPSADVPSWMAAFDVLVLPSRTTRLWAEQFGRVLVEAMACGVPVVVSDSGEMAGVVGPAGRVFPQGDVRALARTLADLSADGAERGRLGALGRARVLERFSQAAVAAATVDFYERLGVGR